METLAAILHTSLGKTIIAFLDSNFFVAIVGLSIFALYRFQLHDQKKSAASAVLFELKNAEKILKRIKQNLENDDAPDLPENMTSIQIESWVQYKYLFINDLDRDEWEALNDFYSKCKLIDDAVLYNKTFFQKTEEQIRVNKYRVAAEYAKSLSDSVTEQEEIEMSRELVSEKFKIFDETFMKINKTYSPMKPVLDAKENMKSINLELSFSSVGIKLKKIAGIK